MSDLVLIIDPDKDQLTSLKVSLEEDGYSVAVAGDGMEGFEKFREVQPNLVITELMLDRLSGFELSSRIAANEGFRAPVIFYTGFYRDERSRNEVVSKYGASDYFVKPFQIQALKRAVAQHFGREVTSPPRVSEAQHATRRPLSDMVLRESQMKMQAGSQAGTQQDEEKPLTVTEDSVSSEPSVAASSSPASVSAEAPAQPSHDALRELPIPQKPPPPPEMPPPQPPEPVGVMPVYGRVDPDLSAETMDGTLAGNSFLPPPRQSPSPAPPFYRSRPLWILAIVMLLGGTFLIVRNSGSLLKQKPDVRAVQHVQVPPGTAPVSQPPTNREGGNTSFPDSGTESTKLGTSSSASSSSPADLRGTSSGGLSSGAAPSPRPHTSESASRPKGTSPATQSLGPNLIISDVTGETGPPYLRKSKRPDIALDKVQGARSTPLVVRVVISREGRVVEAEPLNQNESNASLSQAALAAVQNWEFSPVRGKDEKNWIRYFSFKVTKASQ